MHRTASQHNRVPPDRILPHTLITHATLALAVTLVTPPAVFPGTGSPAVPVPECRNQGNGDEVPCADADAVRLWPDDFRPGQPGVQLPATRDSTDWMSLTVPGAASGHELFHSLDIEGDHLFVAYNAGLQVWDISGSHAEAPLFRVAVDGWRGDFLEFPASTEGTLFTNDVAAVAPAGHGASVLIAVSARPPVGVSIWRFTAPSTLVLPDVKPFCASTTITLVHAGGCGRKVGVRPDAASA